MTKTTTVFDPLANHPDVGGVKEAEVKGVNKAVAYLTKLRAVAVEKEIRATKALYMLVESHPDLTRAETCKAAVLSGLNNRTACNVWDAVHHG
jgi:hypothetical protein